MSRLLIDGFDQLRYAQVSPVFFTDHQFQHAANGNWTKGDHSVRFGGFMFRNATTTLRNGAAANEFNSTGIFLLDLAREAGRNVLGIPRFETRTNLFSLHIRDRCQVCGAGSVPFRGTAATMRAEKCSHPGSASPGASPINLSSGPATAGRTIHSIWRANCAATTPFNLPKIWLFPMSAHGPQRSITVFRRFAG